MLYNNSAISFIKRGTIVGLQMLDYFLNKFLVIFSDLWKTLYTTRPYRLITYVCLTYGLRNLM
jgi:hypothetical protein